MGGAPGRVVSTRTRSSTSLCRSILGFLPRTVLELTTRPVTGTTCTRGPNSGSPRVLNFQDDAYVAEGVPHLPSGPYETGSFIRVHMDGFAPHIHVLYHEVPYILYITTCPEGRCGATLADHVPQLYRVNHIRQLPGIYYFRLMIT
jgi:hypothetical protein